MSADGHRARRTQGKNPMTDIYQIITDKIIAQIEQGVSTYRMPWHSRQHGASELQLPRNVTGRTYRGVNVPVLWATASAFGYSSPIWATYKQWHERGCQVRKGEKAAMVVFLEIKRRQDRRDGRWWRRDRASADCTRLFRLQRGPG